MSAYDNVQRGMALLDRHFGSREAWQPHINLAQLDLRDSHRCIIAQLAHAGLIPGASAYSSGVSVIFGEYPSDSDQAAVDHGFDGSHPDYDEDCARLTEAWREALASQPQPQDGVVRFQLPPITHETADLLIEALHLASDRVQDADTAAQYEGLADMILSYRM